MSTKAYTQIAFTNKLDVFKEHGMQQPVCPRHVAKIQESMAKNGFFTGKPIEVYRDGNFLRIIDGHHRYHAAKILGIGVYYVICDSTQADLIGDRNTTVRKWAMPAWINYYAQKGVKDYTLLASYIKKGLPLTVAGSVLMGESGGSGNYSKHIPRGTYKVKTTTTADKILAIVNELAPVSEVVKTKVFMEAISVLIQLSEFDSEVLVRRIQAHPRDLDKCATRPQMFGCLEEIYNYKSQRKINLAFLAGEWLRNRKESVIAPKKAA